MGSPIRVAIVTVSDGVAAGARDDRGGPACEQALRDSTIEHVVVSREAIPDERDRIAETVRARADAGRVHARERKSRSASCEINS